MILASMHSDAIPSSTVPMQDCSWCWYAEHPTQPFPEHWSSTICADHEDWLLARLAARRAATQSARFVLVETPEPDPLFFPYKPHKNRSCYPSNWSKVSWLLRRVAGFRCEWCKRSDGLACHHMGVPYPTGKRGNRHDKHDLRRENLYVLCRYCHEAVEDWQAAQEHGIDYELVLPDPLY